jgi:hypothetical protein
MALLQLAENNLNMLAENEMYLSAGAVGDNYLFIPSGMFGMEQDTYVRNDFFDSLSDTEFDVVMSNLAPYQPQGLSAIGAILTAAQVAGKKLTPAIQKAIEKRSQKVADGTVKPIFKPGGPLAGLADKVKAGINKLKDVPADKAKDVIEKTTPVTGSLDIGNTTLDFSSGQPTDIPFFTKYKTPLLIGGAAVAGLVLFSVLKKK